MDAKIRIQIYASEGRLETAEPRRIFEQLMLPHSRKNELHATLMRHFLTIRLLEAVGKTPR